MPMVKDALSALKDIRKAGYGEFVIKNNIHLSDKYNYFGYLHTIHFCRDTFLISDKSKYTNKVTVYELIDLLEQAVVNRHGGEYLHIRVDGEVGYPKMSEEVQTIIVDTREKIVCLCSIVDLRGEVGRKYYHLASAYRKSTDEPWMYREF